MLPIFESGCFTEKSYRRKVVSQKNIQIWLWRPRVPEKPKTLSKDWGTLRDWETLRNTEVHGKLVNYVKSQKLILKDTVTEFR